MGARGIGPYGRAGDPGHTSTLPALPPGKPDATRPTEKIPSQHPGAASGANPEGSHATLMVSFCYSDGVLLLPTFTLVHRITETTFLLRCHIFPAPTANEASKAIGLKKEQKDAIRKEVRQTQSSFIDLQWDLQDTMESMLPLLSQNDIDEKAALALFQQAMESEIKMKRTHITLAIHIKNLLTPDQQAQLNDIKRRQKLPHHSKRPP